MSETKENVFYCRRCKIKFVKFAKLQNYHSGKIKDACPCCYAIDDLHCIVDYGEFHIDEGD